MATEETSNVPDFEIDRPEVYAHFLLTQENDILSYLHTLARQHAILTVYLDDGQTFFLSSILSVDDAKGTFLLDPANSDELRRKTDNSSKLTLTTLLDKVKIQIRVTHRQYTQLSGRPAISIRLPKNMLRLQRREFFRLPVLSSNPLHCKLPRHFHNRPTQFLTLPLLDISGGGVGMMGQTNQASQFLVGTTFKDCQLEIPGEGAIPINLCIRQSEPQQTGNRDPFLRIGCEYVFLPSTRLNKIQRYIAQLERERKARESTLSTLTP